MGSAWYAFSSLAAQKCLYFHYYLRYYMLPGDPFSLCDQQIFLYVNLIFFKRGRGESVMSQFLFVSLIKMSGARKEEINCNVHYVKIFIIQQHFI